MVKWTDDTDLGFTTASYNLRKDAQANELLYSHFSNSVSLNVNPREIQFNMECPVVILCDAAVVSTGEDSKALVMETAIDELLMKDVWDNNIIWDRGAYAW